MCTCERVRVLSGILGVAGYGLWRAVWTAAVGAGGREASTLVLHRIALRILHMQTRRFFLPSTATLPSGQSCPAFCRGLSKEPTCCDTWGGGQGRGEDDDNDTREATDGQSAIEFAVRGSSVSANQQVRKCKQVSFGQTACPVARPRSFRPPLQTHRFPSFPVVSPRFSSFLGRSASDLRRTSALGRRSPAKQVRSWQKCSRGRHHVKRGMILQRP